MTPEDTALVERLEALDEDAFHYHLVNEAAAALRALAGETEAYKESLGDADYNCMQLRAEVEALKRDAIAQGARILTLSQERDALRAEVERLSKLDCQASAHVESVVCMRTHFTGEPPYVGWLGIGLAINEVIDERDTLRAEVERLREEEELTVNLCDRLAGLLRHTADALKGPPPELTQHSTHDLPEVAAALRAELDAAIGAKLPK